MKKALVVVTIAALLMICMAWYSNAADKRLNHFSIIVTQTEKGIEMSCKEGCAWTKLTSSCGDKLPCSSLVDETGVQGIDDKDAK